MEFEEVVRARTAVRKYKEEQLSKEDLDKILEAARLAPTGKNIQPQMIYVAQSKEAIEKIDKTTLCRYGAPTVLIVCCDKNKAWHNDNFSTYQMDASIVATHMMLEAANINVGSVWIDLFDVNKLKEEFNLPEGMEPICLLPMGYPADDYKGNPLHGKRKPIEELVKYL